MPVSKSRIDVGRFRRWMSTCLHDYDHRECRSPAFDYLDRSGLRQLRVIDVFNQCLVDAPEDCRYLALSYVWGGVPKLRLTTNNMQTLYQSGSLREHWNRIPKTIRDSIELVKLLGERYLWIDALCLVQNDKDDVEKGLTVMDLIYENATMTIIAACCNHADESLPGVTESSRSVDKRIETIRPGVQLALRIDLEYLMQQSTYSKRAWT